MLIYPVRKIWISADYSDHGYKALDMGWWDSDPAMPNDSGRNPHLYAMADGVVVQIVNSHPDEPDMEGYGNYIVIRYPGEGYVSLYAHIKKDSFLVRVGDKVSQRQPVCRMGNSGYSFGNHIHLEVCKGSTFVRHGGVDYMPFVYATAWHVVDSDTERDYPIQHMVLEPTDRDVTKEQVHVTGKDLRIRKAPVDGEVVGFASIGYYDVEELVEGGGYTWAKVSDYYMAANTDVSTLCPIEFKPTERDTSRAQAEVAIDDLRIRLEPSTSSTIMGYCPKGYYNIQESVSEEDYVWFKVNGYYIAVVDGVTYLAPDEDPKDKQIKELEEKVALLEERLSDTEDALYNASLKNVEYEEKLKQIKQICG